MFKGLNHLECILKVNNIVCFSVISEMPREPMQLPLVYCYKYIVTFLGHDVPRGQFEVQHWCRHAKISFAVLRGQLEMLEDKLRELRLLALDPREYDDRTVTLSQLDSLRRELIGTAKNNLKYVDFSKVRFTLHNASIHQLQPKSQYEMLHGRRAFAS